MLVMQSAIRYSNGEVMVAKRHNQITSLAHKLGISSVGSEQGFVTSTGLFLSREEAKKLAIKNSQISKDHKGPLYSEDLWPEVDLSTDD